MYNCVLGKRRRNRRAGYLTEWFLWTSCSRRCGKQLWKN